MPVPTTRGPGRSPGRSRMLVASALAAALAVLASSGTPTASANLPVERGHHDQEHQAKVQKVKVDPRIFGVHDAHAQSLSRAGTGSIRLWDSATMWKDIFPTADDLTDGTGHWDRLDSLVEQAHANGTEVTLVFGLTPSYAGATQQSPPDPSMYADYVRAVMERYAPTNWGYRGIAAYQVWNETNIETFWTGTYDEMGRLVSTVDSIRDQVDKGAKVVAPAMVTRLTYQQNGIKHFFQTEVDGKPIWKFFDAISLNLYPLDSYPNPNPTRAGTPEDSMALLSTVRGILAKDGVPKAFPIWNTEINYGLRFGVNGGQPAVPISNDRQVAYLIRTYLLNAAQGVKRVDWYSYDLSDRGGQGALGNTLLTDPTNQSKGILLPAGLAFTRVQSWMKGTLIGTRTKQPCIRDKHGTYTCTIEYRSGMGRVYWNPYKSAKVKLVKSARKKVDEYGVASKAKGGHKLKVTYKPVLVKSKR